MIKNVTLGCDAEMFVKSRKDGSVFPVCGLVGGTKKKPKPMGTGGFFIQEDNILLEFNVPVAKDKVSWVVQMLEGVKRASNQLPPSLFADVKASGHLDAAFLTIKQATVFGCDPDFNAWLREVNPRPACDDPTLRTAAAHVHIGWDNPTEDDAESLIQFADLCAVIPSLYEDEDVERRKLYGKAGAFRFKKYGVEHRVLSNYWIQNKGTIASVWDRYMRAIAMVNDKVVLSVEDCNNIQHAINNRDLSVADKLVQKWKLA